MEQRVCVLRFRLFFYWGLGVSGFCNPHACQWMHFGMMTPDPQLSVSSVPCRGLVRLWIFHGCRWCWVEQVWFWFSHHLTWHCLAKLKHKGNQYFKQVPQNCRQIEDIQTTKGLWKEPTWKWAAWSELWTVMVCINLLQSHLGIYAGSHTHTNMQTSKREDRCELMLSSQMTNFLEEDFSSCGDK